MKIELNFECTTPSGKCRFTKSKHLCIEDSFEGQASVCEWLKAERKQ